MNRVANTSGASSMRTAFLMAVLLALLSGYIAWPFLQPSPAASTPRPMTQPPLPGSNSVSNLSVKQNDAGGWSATFDYFYTGQPAPAHIQVQIPGTPAAASAPNGGTISSGFQQALRGHQHITIDIQHPAVAEIKTTRSVTAVMTFQGRPIAAQQAAVDITWPDWNTWARDRDLAGKTPEQIVDRAVALIDAGSRWELAEAKRLLERILTKSPQADAAYVELARVAMKSNWGPEGLHHAEGLIQSALQIRPDSGNAKILLGYVFTHQGRYRAAEALFEDASKTPSKNLWLWANWGEALAMQGKFDAAVEKYREALAKPPTRDTYDRARLDAYWKLLALLERRKDFDGMEVLHKQRVADYGPRDCHGTDYARFLLQHRGDSAT
ncbi:MAG TPA: tetratricopeptide repeat protein, partial [Burkholderiaceae bacterium]|nr:tetratricopeptide repeat protein [Burkholderiaceae bacterium]